MGTVFPSEQDHVTPGRAQWVRARRELRVAALICGAAIALGTATAYAYSPVWAPGWRWPVFVWLATFFFRTQDAPWLVAAALFLVGIWFIRFPASSPRSLTSLLRHPRVITASLAAAVLMIGAAGTELIFHGYHLSRDEIQADFDSEIFRFGNLVAPVSAEWQPFARALQPHFMLPIPEGRGFASAYLPVNAAIRAVVGLLWDPAWANPLLAAFSVIVLFNISRRLWPDRPDASVVSMVLLATSSQVLITAMTSYAMTAHLALNLLWLWLFVRDDRIGYGAAIGVGFLATGLHQLAFHPLFAAPFILRLWLSRRRRVALVFIGSYSAICVFWMGYPQLVLYWQGLAPDPFGSFIVGELLLLLSFDWSGGAGLMLKNLLRFVAWQNPLLLPLSLLAFWSIRKGQGITRELVAGVVLTLIMICIVLPNQIHGWGFRYLHGLIGNMALLAGYGWIAISPAATSENVGASWRLFIISAALAGFVLLPAHAKQAQDFTMPYVKAHKAIVNAPTDIVLIEKSGMLFAEDLVQNDPFLRNRPKVLDLALLDEMRVSWICSQFRVSIFDHQQGHSLGILPDPAFSRFGAKVTHGNRAVLRRLSCGTELLAVVKEAELGGLEGRLHPVVTAE
jgi:hypothetical protein